MIPIENSIDIIPLQKKCYERLEFLGDSVIRLVVCEYLYNRYPKENEGFLSKLKIKIECGETLSKLSKLIGLDKFMLISRHIEVKGRAKGQSQAASAETAAQGAAIAAQRQDP